MTILPRRVGLFGALTLLTAALAGFRLIDTLPEGLRVTYVAHDEAGARPPAVTIDRHPSTASLETAWGGRPPSAFDASWSGTFVVLRGGRFTFATNSDDGSTVIIDGQGVVENGGDHAGRLATGTIDLDAGVHTILIDYVQDGGDFAFALFWARGGAPLEALPAWALSTHRVGFGRALASVAVRRALWPVAALWFVTLLIVGGARLRDPAARWSLPIRDDSVLCALTGVIAMSVLLNAAGLWWGIPSTWAGDEMTPFAVYTAMTNHFSGGWWDRYPPLHYVVLSVATAPAVWLRSLDWLALSDRAHDGLIIVITRLVSVVAGAGTLIAVYLCGARAFGRRAGLYGAAMLALLAPFLYYSKTANPEVPYIFWFMTSLVFYLRFMQTLALRDVVLFAASATAAMCTKDQAYGLYLAAPAPFVYQLWQANRRQGVSRPLVRAVLDQRIALAGVTVAALFAVIYLLPFNLAGFLKHFQDITGPGSEPWRMFEPTLRGRLTLLGVNLDLNQRSWGWPFAIVCLAGIGLAFADRRTRPAAVWLLLPIVSYYIGFIDLILYTFDRYVLPMCVIEAIFGGLAIERFLHPDGRQSVRWRQALLAGAFVYTFFYAATVDVLMIRDSRYPAERWLRERLRPGEGVGVNFPERVLPRMDGIPWVEIGSAEHLRADAPRYFILNADYARAIGPDTLLGEMIAELQGGSAGYRLAFRYRTPAPWPWLGGHPDLVGPRLDTRVLSILHHINPTIEIFERDR